MSVDVTNVFDFIDTGEEGLLVLSEKLSSFSCGLNPEIEDFLKNSAVDFARRNLSITYLVTDLDDSQILGYFTLTHKSILISDTGLSNTARKKLARYSRFDRKTGNYMASAFLLAQFGKNYAVDGGKRIKGADLMQLVLDILLTVQRQIGGGIVYLDCENKAKLVTFVRRQYKMTQ